MTTFEKTVCGLFWTMVIGMAVWIAYDSGAEREMRLQLQADEELIKSLYQQIATTEIACDMAIEQAQVSCVD